MTRFRSQYRLLVHIFALTACLGLTTVSAFAQIEIDAHECFKEASQLRSEQREDSNQKSVEKYREAGRLWRDARIFQQAAVAFRNAGEVLNLLGESADALRNYNEALKLAKRGWSPLEEARTYNDLAYLHFITGNTKEAHKNCLAALKKARQLHDLEIEAEALSNLGEVFYSFGNLEKAQESQKLSLTIWAKLGNQRGQAMALIALGYYYVNLGERDKALESYSDGLLRAQAAHDLSVETLARLAIGNIKRKFGEKQEALESYEAAKVLATRIGDKTSQAIVAGGIGYVSLDLGDYKKALQHIEEATRLFESNGKKWGAAEGKLDLGKIHRALGNRDKALESLAEALALFKSLSMRRLESLTLREIGAVHHERGDTATALPILKQALALISINKDKRQAAYTLNQLGNVYESLDDGNKALANYRLALPLSRAAADPESEALTCYNLAHVERDRGNLDEARRHVDAALAIVESQRTKVSSQDLRTSYFATVRNTYDLYIDILMLLHARQPHLGLDLEAFAVSERARARSFLELLHEARANVRLGVDPALLAKERQLNETLNTKGQLHLQHLTAKQIDEAAKTSAEIERLVDELSQVRAQIRQSSPRLANLKMPELLSLKAVQQRVLDEETVLIEYVLGDDRSYVWVVTRTASYSYLLPRRAVIDAAARRLYNLVTSAQLIYGESTSARVARQTKADAEIPAEIASLSKLILGPLAGKLNKKRLLVVTDATLQYIPFQLLTNPDAGNRLIDAHEIVNLPSASTLALLQTEAATRKPSVNSVAVLADPVFEADDPRVKQKSERKPETTSSEVRQALRDVGISPDGVEIPRLIASGFEADGIMRVAPWRTGLKAVGFAANRERVLGPELASYRIIHFATHGMINNEHPELSGIVLSLFDSEGRSRNGFLRLHDIYNLRLPADLVVLSACSTGLGKEVRGEGVIGLTRGFMHAGASGVIASLWKVDDDATAELMKHFYEAMFKKNMAPAEALRESQLALSRQKRWQSPYYWAGFVIQGQYARNAKFIEPFPSRTQMLLFGTTSGCLMLALILFIRQRRRRST